MATTAKEADLRGWNRKDQHFNLDILSSSCLLKIQVDMKSIQLTVKAWSEVRGLR